MKLEPEKALELYQEVSHHQRPDGVLDRDHLLQEPGQPIPLPAPRPEGGMPLWETVGRRRSVRLFVPQPLTLEELTRLLWATQGITGQRGTTPLRAAPSAAAAYTVETYLSVHQVEGLAPGIYHYRTNPAALELRAEGDLSQRLAQATFRQPWMRQTAVAFFWTAVLERIRSRYRERALRYVYLDAGHICQNLYLAAAALGLGCCGVGDFYDDEMEALIGVDGGREFMVYMAGVGRVR